ncbi:hypothetical protein THIOKS11320109 [Thiocapsa sp. KS1]|nr:hypothetical protein THIOKS11320109 [Thiocapsa sp. KS1]
MHYRNGAGFATEYRTALSSRLFTEFKPDREVVEIRQEKVLYSKYYPNFAEFRVAITDCLKQTHTTHKKELDSLLTLNFQAFKKCELVPI